MLNISSMAAMFGLLAVVLSWIAARIYKWKSKVDKKNLRLMQLYLELKFLYKNLTDSAVVTSSTVFCRNLILSIKEYYNLEEIVIIDSVKMSFQSNNMNVLKKAVYSLVQKNEVEIKRRLDGKTSVTQYMEIDGKKYIFYIFDLIPDVGCDGFIVCVENYPTLLTKSELLGLENNINLLKTRMLSD